MSEIRAIIDRIEGNMAVVLVGEDSHRITLPVTVLPDDAGEGTVLRINIEIDQQSTAELRQKVRNIIDRLSGGTDLH